MRGWMVCMGGMYVGVCVYMFACACMCVGGIVYM